MNLKNYKPNPPKEDLEQLYFSEYKTQSEIGSIYGVTQKVVCRWFKTVGIKSRVAVKRNQRGDRNHQWKGDKASYTAFHYRLRNLKGKANHCETCGRSDSGIKYDWANQTGNYHDVKDYKMMCRSCHFKMDGLKNNFPNRRDGILINKSKAMRDAARGAL